MEEDSEEREVDGWDRKGGEGVEEINVGYCVEEVEDVKHVPSEVEKAVEIIGLAWEVVQENRLRVGDVPVREERSKE